ncbi:MAG: hypothetical protein U9R79_10435 [Armatimonadota bacterium]|nr:hypothetical protein [Armatimonadota bacterium]
MRERPLELAERTARDHHPLERDFVRAHWLLGWVVTELAQEESARRDERVAEAEEHLTEALRRCRRIDLVESEPDILVA